MTQEAAAIKTLIDAEQLRADLGVNIAAISDQLATQASLYVHYAQQTVRAKMQLDRWQRALEVLEAQLSNHYRESLATEPDPESKSKRGSGKPTEPQILAAVHTDARYKACRSKVSQAEEVYRMCQVAERGFEQRKDLILQIARDQSKEREGSLRVLGNQSAQGRAQQYVEQIAAQRAKGSHD